MTWAFWKTPPDFPRMQGKQKVDLFHHMNAQNKAGPGWNEAPPWHDTWMGHKDIEAGRKCFMWCIHWKTSRLSVVLKNHFFVCLLRIGHKFLKLIWSLIFRVAEQQMPLKVSKFDVQPSGFMWGSCVLSFGRYSSHRRGKTHNGICSTEL